MALDEDVFAQLYLTYLQEEMEAVHSNILKNVRVSEVPQDDGSVRMETENEFGPIEIDTEKLRPMAKAMGRAIVEFLKGNAEVPIQNVQSGTSTITGRIT